MKETQSQTQDNHPRTVLEILPSSPAEFSIFTSRNANTTSCACVFLDTQVKTLLYLHPEKRHGVSPLECVPDAKSAIRWVRTSANEFDIDSNRILAAGGRSGGHLAACAALLAGFDEKNEDLKVSSVPNALMLFNPALDIPSLMKNPPQNMVELFVELLSDVRDRADEISPIHHMRKDAPPTIIFHGTADTSVPFEQATRFCELMKNQYNYCQVIPFVGRPHAFFNYGRGDNADYHMTLRKTNEFLVSLKYLKGEPTIK